MQLENAGRILLESIRGADNSGGHMSIHGADAKGPKIKETGKKTGGKKKGGFIDIYVVKICF